MGRIIAFPAVPTTYPDLAADLDNAERLLLGVIRWRVACYREGEDPIPRLFRSLDIVGMPDAAFSIGALMTVVTHAVARPIDVYCPGCPQLSLDENHLPQGASLTQANESALARKVLRTALLSAQGGELAIAPLQYVGELLARARVMLCSRRLPAADHSAAVDPDRQPAPFGKPTPGNTR